MTAREVLDRVDELCKERGWKHYKLSQESGIPTSTLYNMFKRGTMPQIETLERFCDGFQITMGEFFTVDKKKSRSDLTKEETEYLELFNRLPQSERRLLMAYGEGLEKMLKKKK